MIEKLLKEYGALGVAVLALIAALERNTQRIAQLVRQNEKLFEQREDDLKDRREKLDERAKEKEDREKAILKELQKLNLDHLDN